MTPDTARLAIRMMRQADIPAGQRLREQEGWNQSDADWQRLLDWEAEGCFVGELRGQIVASATTTTYGPDLAWIGMVLVDVECRQQGFGRQIFQHAMRHLDDRGVRTIGLDSTPLARAMYDRLGYRDAYLLERRRGTIPELPAGQARPIGPADLPALIAFDRRAFGLDRARIVERLASDRPDGGFIAEMDGIIQGYLLSRPGARAWHIGPLVSTDAEAAWQLTCAALQAHPGEEAVMDVVQENAVAVEIATRLGLAPVRPFIRMLRGPAPVVDLRLLGTSAGPELG